MRVRLVSYSTPADELFDKDISNIQDLIAFCARVSNPTNQYNIETAGNLIRYLIKHKHWSPLEMVNMCLEIETTRDIARQILRHRSFSFQEFSQRYADPTVSLDFETREARFQDKFNRQASHALDPENKEHTHIQAVWKMKQQNIIMAAREAYDWAIENGIAKEQARVVFPEGCTRSKLYMNGTLRSWVHYIDLRTDSGTQKEHMEVAFACAEVISKLFPMIEDFYEKE